MNLRGDRIRFRIAHPQAGLRRGLHFVLLGTLGWVGFSDRAQGDSLDDGEAKAASTLPNIYLDLRTIYSVVPANTLSIGFSNPSLTSALATFRSLSALPNFPVSPGLSLPSSRGIGIDAPLTVDLSDRISVYGGFSASASQSGMSEWSTLAISRLESAHH